MTGALLLSIVRHLTAASSFQRTRMGGTRHTLLQPLASDVPMLRLTAVITGSHSRIDLHRSIRQTTRSSYRRHWKFRMRRAWAAKHGHDGADAAGPHGSTARIVPQHRSQAWAWLIIEKRFLAAGVCDMMHLLRCGVRPMRIILLSSCLTAILASRPIMGHGCLQVQLQLAALKRRAAVRGAKLAATEAATATPTGQAGAHGSNPQHQQHRRDPARDHRMMAGHAASEDSGEMGAREAAASVVSAFELRQQPTRPGWSSAGCGDSASPSGSHAAASRPGPTERSGADTTPDDATDEHCWQASTQYTGREAGEETASHRRVPSGGEHLRHQLDGLRRKKKLRAQVGADEV